MDQEQHMSSNALMMDGIDSVGIGSGGWNIAGGDPAGRRRKLEEEKERSRISYVGVRLSLSRVGLPTAASSSALWPPVVSTSIKRGDC